MSELIVIAIMAAVALVWWAVSEVLFRRNQNRKNIRFHGVLEDIVEAKTADEMIAIRDAYRNELRV